MVYVASFQKIMMFGGQDGSYRTSYETWFLDTKRLKWERVGSNAPLGRADPVFSYIQGHGNHNDIVFLFGSWYNDSMGKLGRPSDTWYCYPLDNR